MSARTAKTLLARAWCDLVGCEQEEHGPCCHRCGEHLYEGFVQYGRLDPLFRLYWRVRRLLRRVIRGKRCRECDKKFRCGFDDDFCSEECADVYLPF